jgi:hypothetical protein
MTEPVRLLSSGSSGAKELLRSARGDGPSHAQLGHLAAKLAPTVVAAPTASALLPWLFAGVAVLGAAGIVIVGRRDPSPPAPAPAIVTPATPVIAPPAAPPPVTTPTEIPRQDPPPAPAIARPPKQRIATPPVQTVEPAPLPREMDLLTPALAALRNDPARALALAERHASLYAQGAFAEEREAIAIEALHRLGQRDRARARLAEFATNHPRSSYRARLDRLVRE